MENFNFCAPTYFAFGKNSEDNAGKLVKKFGGSKVLIHYGSESVKKSGLLARVINSLKSENIPFIELGGVVPNPRSGKVYEGIKICKDEDIDYILAVGGGSVIDSAKAIAIGALYEGDFWDYYGTDKEITKALPIGTVLTIAAAGSEGSTGSVITHEEGNFKRSAGGELLRPKFSILNPELTCTLPEYQTACGITDMMAHVCERYFTNTENVEITDRLCEGILKAIIEESPKVMKNPNDYEARANIMWAGMVAHNNVCGVGREQDWSSHRIEHELSGLYDVAHGAGLAIVMPSWMEYVVKHDINRFVKFATRVWECELHEENLELTALEGIKSFRKFLKQIGMPSNFKDIDAKEEDIKLLVAKLGLGKDGTLGSFVKLREEDIEKIYKLCL